MAGGSTLWSLFQSALVGATFTDLTHPFQPGQPHFAAFPDEERSMVFDFAKGDAFQVHRYGFVGQWGTHVDPPIHFIEGGRTLDAIPVSEMLLPLVILDITAKVAGNPDAVSRFRNEVRVARRVSHPNVCRVYDLAEVDGQFFLSMEYVDGENLDSLLRR